ncbi:mannitol-1-phosphate 5-dehydrogenase [Proteiniclasticum ruminis]|uniref:Mannitol-1-phosphate 5-dehydrogenase n=1 Tax=Proteiniclasticum ruminis TaxID=398199 RepID=A0A1G8PI09_9CLOT|nr:mannitol-1-phosphate 5-dehydrogenase [Proteiniclasticum ruminis]SDI92151.1 mannitol-1-phosphate 5-dehydrogenase [Proteiniclasticum ruminis]
MNALHFGAGNIGRGFIGLLLAQNGFQVTFADVSEVLIDAIKKEGKYRVILADESHEAVPVEGVFGINSAKEPDALKEAVLKADLITTAVGVNIVPHIGRSLLEGIKERLHQEKVTPFSIIACENAVGATKVLKEALYEGLSEDEKTLAEMYIGFPNSAVDRIVPMQKNENPLDVQVEPFFEWVVEEDAVKGELRSLEGVHYVKDLTPYIERKLFTVNTGHAATAYFGLLKGHETVLQAMKDEEVVTAVRGVLKETSAYIVKSYGFDEKEHQAYVEKILSRFENPYISDDLTRVARSPIRKISPSDRFMKPAMGLISLGLEPKDLARAIAALLLYINEEDPEAVVLQKDLKELGLSEVLLKYAGLSEEDALAKLIKKEYILLTD